MGEAYTDSPSTTRRQRAAGASSPRSSGSSGQGRLGTAWPGSVEDVALIGPWSKTADDLQRWKQTVLTTFSVSCDLRHLPKVADLARG